MIPLATTTITVTKPAGGGDPYDDADITTTATAVRAHIGRPSGAERVIGGQQERVDAVLACDPFDGFDHYCIVTDDVTGDVWQVEWTRRRSGLGLDHFTAGLRAVGGVSNG